MSIESDNESQEYNTTPSVSNISHSLIDTRTQKKVMEKITKITDPDEMKMYVSNHHEILVNMNTKFLNHWNKIEGYKFIRRNGFIYFSVFNSGSAETIKKLRNDINELTTNFERMKEIINKILTYFKNNNVSEIFDELCSPS
jgi:DNA-binding beta-propeller fold protein YncE